MCNSKKIFLTKFKKNKNPLKSNLCTKEAIKGKIFRCGDGLVTMGNKAKQIQIARHRYILKDKS